MCMFLGVDLPWKIISIILLSYHISLMKKLISRTIVIGKILVKILGLVSKSVAAGPLPFNRNALPVIRRSIEVMTGSHQRKLTFLEKERLTK